MAENTEGNGFLVLQCHPHHPHHAEDMVGMGMGDKHVANVFYADAGKVELSEYAIAAASINKQMPSTLASQHKAGVVATHGHCVTGAKYNDFGIHCN